MTDWFLTRTLTTAQTNGLRVLEALRWPTPFGSAVRLYLGTGSDMELESAKGSKATLSRVKKVGSNAIAALDTVSGTGPISLDLGQGAFTLDTVAPETDLFEDLDVILGQRHGETPEQVADWLRFHIDTHQTTGIVLVDRAPASDGFAAALRVLIEDIALARLLVISSPLPLGAPTQPAVFDTSLAPRVKSNKKPKPDPWRSTLQEPLLYDIMRWRFLARAGGVSSLPIGT